MEEIIGKGFVRGIALLLCAALLLPVIPAAVFAEETQPVEQTEATSVTESTESAQEETVPTAEETQSTEAETTATEAPAATEEAAVYGTNLWNVDNVNFFAPGESVVVWGYSARELGQIFNWADGTSTNAPFDDGDYLTDAARESFANADFTNYTALVVEFLGRSNTNEEAAAGRPEYYVEAIVDGSKETTIPMADLHAATELGFVFYVPTQTFAAGAVSRGDLIWSNFWIQSPDLVCGSNGLPSDPDSRVGQLSVTDNPAAAVSAVTPANVNATVRLFNYDSTAYTNYSYGFNFWNGDYGYGADVESVDGWGVNNGVLQNPKALSTLSAKGYPQVSDWEGKNTAALDYLFDSTYLKGTMTNGGGLFQVDSEGYYYYDSLKNAAWYDPDANKFALYDLIVRPWADSNDASNEAYGNFLPFNRVTADNITMDGTLFNGERTAIESVSPVQGSLEYAGLTTDAAYLVLDDDGNNRLKSTLREYTTAATARLEEKSDLWFGMSMDFAFSMPKGGIVGGKDMTFDFHGDDDVFVYIGVWNGSGYDYTLVLDIGGVHGARSGSINFATGDVSYHAGYPDGSGTQVSTDLKTIFSLEGDTFADYEKLSLKFFYMERGGNISYCRMRFNIPTLPDNSLTVEKELTGENAETGVSDYIAESYTYQFRIARADQTEEAFLKAGTPYNILENGFVTGSGVLNEDGVFTLKANQSAQFENVLENRADDTVSHYVVQELLPTELTGQYHNVSYIIGGAGGEVVTGSAGSTAFTSYQTGALSGDQHQQVIFRNAVDFEKLGTLRITKVLTQDVEESLREQQFRMQVKLNGGLLSVGTAYTVTDGTATENKTVTRAGEVILTAGQTAVIQGILSGAAYTVSELDTVTGVFKPVYTGTATGETEETVTCTQNSASGRMPLAGTVDITVTNGKKNSELHVDKTVEATDDPNAFKLTLEAFATGHVESVANGPKDIVLVLDQSASMFAPVGGQVDFDNSRVYQLDNVLTADALDTNLASHLGYYVAQSTSGRGPFTDSQGTQYYLYDWFIVRYYEGAWYYVRVANFQKAVDMDLSAQVDGAISGELGTTFARSEAMTFFNYYKSQYGALYDAICTFVDGVRQSGVNHRIAVTGFASGTYDGRSHYDGTGIYVNGAYYLYDTDYAFKNSDGKFINPDTEAVIENPNDANVTQVYGSALVDVATDYASIMNSVNAVTTNYLQTCPAAGLDMAKKIFAAAGTSDRGQMVILFTDGHPTVTIEASLLNSDRVSLEQAALHWSESAGKNQAIAYAKALKDAGVEIFAIGTGAVYGEKFLNAVSSDYPNATGWPVVADGYWLAESERVTPSEADINAKLGDPIDEPMYTTFVTSSVDLENIFNSIQSIVTSTSVNLDGTAVLKEVLSDYFDLTGDETVSVEVYTADYLGDGVFAEPVRFADAAVTLTSSGGDARMDTVNVSGFSYKDNFVAEAYTDEDGTEHPASGKKLIVKVKVTTRAGFWGGNNVPTNDETTGIYSGDVPVIRFPVPEVNVPLSLGIAAQDKTIYYGGAVTAAELLQGVYAGGLSVHVGTDGALSPQADWMDDYASLSWTAASVSPGDPADNRTPGDYTFAVTLTPEHTGTVNQSANPSNLAGTAVGSVSAWDTGHVYILVPAVTFKDSTIVEGYTPGASYYPANNYVDTQWVHMDESVPEDAPAVSGEAPDLTLTYTPVGTENGDTEYFVSDTKINVTVSSEAVADIAAVTVFLWQRCGESLHSSTLHGTIADHKADTADRHEFWIHVPNADDSKTGVVVDKTVAGTEDPNKFVLTLEAYAKGELKSVNVTKPADIVLVLDHSGSMHTPVGAPQVLDNESVYSTTGDLTEDQLDTDLGAHFGYYVAQSVSTKSWFILQFDKSTNLWSGYLVHSTEAIVNTSAPGRNADPDGSEGWTEHFMKLTWVKGQIDDNLVFYKSQYGMLYDAVHEFVQDLRQSGVEHRVAIIGFSSSADTFLYAGGTEGAKRYHAMYDSSEERRNELFRIALKNVQDQDAYSDLVSCIDSINTNYSFTCPAAGIHMATDLFAANPIDMAERDRIMVLFTDGIPNKKIGGGAGTTETQNEIFEEIVQRAYTAKSSLGAQIYSISTTTLGAGADRRFLSYASSDYPDATGFATPGTPISPQRYTSEVDAVEDLHLVFGSIKETTTSTSVTLDGTAVLREVLSDYFNLDNGTVTDISVYTRLYNGADGTWGALDPFTAEEGMVLNLTSSDGSDRLDTISVSGFNYHDEYVSNVERERNGAEYYGSKLVVKVTVQTRTGFWGGNNVPTNESSTAIYSKDTNGKETVVEKFPMPEVNVPITPEIVAKDKTVYYGGDATASDLLEKVTVGGVDVIIDGDTLRPAEDWMDDFASLTFTENSTKPSGDASGTEPKDYPFEILMKPEYDGTSNRSDDPSNMAGTPVDTNGVTDSDTGHVYVLVPEVTFRDSTIETGYKPDADYYGKTNHVSTEWVNMETDLPEGTVVPAPSGTAPELTLTYAPESGDFLNDTKVQVSVSSSDPDGDISAVTKFRWETCDQELHDHTAQPGIGDHYANEDSHEFWIHVPLVIKPDTVVIDFGLPVDIDVLSNDPVVGDAVRQLLGIAGADTGEFADSHPGTFGVATVLESDLVRYVLNTANGMEMDREEVFRYGVRYTAGENSRQAQSTVTVIPATTIYYEEGFVTFKSFDMKDDQEITDAQSIYRWTTDGTLTDATQSQDRPGADAALESLDADNIYGYDPAYANSSTHSLGRAMKITVDSNAYGTASFSFRGTGFDVVSLTSNMTGSIVVSIYDKDNKMVKSLMVDTYYGYKYEGGKWVVDGEATDTLYQVPVMKVTGLPYGKYTAVITVSYASFLDHNKADKSYDFYLDAIRIYDPANDGSGNTIIENAYKDDGEGWPSYQELRNLLITANDFDAITEGENASGIIFIDNTLDADNQVTYTISDYTNFGPNNELYLAPGQAAAFNLNGGDDVAGIHFAMKSVGGTVRAKVYDAADTGKTSLVPEQISTATDLYYDVTALIGKTVVIVNDAESEAILSVTNIKTTYTQKPTSQVELTISPAQAELAVALLSRTAEPEESAPGETEPEATQPQPTQPQPTQPPATEPTVTQPVQTEPAATEPAPQEPAPADTEPEQLPEETVQPETEETAPAGEPEGSSIGNGVVIGLIVVGAVALLSLALWLAVKRKEEK